MTIIDGVQNVVSIWIILFVHAVKISQDQNLETLQTEKHILKTLYV